MKKILSIILSFALLIAPIGASCVRVDADGTFNAVVGSYWNQTNVNASGDALGIWQYKLIQNEWKNMAGTYSGASGVQGFTFTTAAYGWDGYHLMTNDIKDVCGLQAYHIYDVTFKITHTGANATNIHFLTEGGLGSYNISKKSTTISNSTGPVTFSGQIVVDEESELTLTIDMGVNATGGSSGCQKGTLQITEANFVDTGQTIPKMFRCVVYDASQHEDESWDKTSVAEKDDEQGLWEYKLIQNEWNNMKGAYSGAEGIKDFTFNYQTYGWNGFHLKTKDLKTACNLQYDHIYTASFSVKYSFEDSDPPPTNIICSTEGGLGNYNLQKTLVSFDKDTYEYTFTGTVCPIKENDLSLKISMGVDELGKSAGCAVGDLTITDVSFTDSGWTPVANNNSSVGVGPWGLFALFDAEHPTYGHWAKLSYKTVNNGEDVSDTTILVRSKSGWLGADASWARIRDYASNRLEVGTHTQATIVINSSKDMAEDASIKVGIGDHSELFTLHEGDNVLVTEEFTYNDQYSMDISFELDMVEVGTELNVKSIDLLNGVEPEDDEEGDVVDPVLSPDTMSVEDDGATWSDEFNGTELDENKWVIQEGNRSGPDGPINWGNNEKENYKAENVSVGNGVLNIEAKEEKTTIGTGEDALEYDYTSGRINTRGKFSAGFGYVEARLKLSTEKGLWPAFWMLGEKKATWPRNGEIDILEQANTNDYFQSTVHFYNSTWGSNDEHHTSKNDEEAHEKMSNIDFSQYHNYGVNRNGDTIAFYLDREKVYEYVIENDRKKSPSRYPSAMNNDYYLLLNLAVGGNFTQNQLPENLPKSMQVDYVRYYETQGLNRIQPDTWTTVGAWELYNGKDDWCDYARINYEQSEGSGLGDTKMILTESPRSDNNDKEYGLGARLNDYSEGKMVCDQVYKAKITLNSSKAGTLITNVEGVEYRLDIDEGDNVIYTDSFVYDEFSSYSTTPSHNPRDVYFYLGMMPKSTEITISNVEFEAQEMEWTPVPNFNPDKGGEAQYHSAGQLKLFAMYGPQSGLYGKMQYKVENDGEDISDTTVKVTSTTIWGGDERPYSTNIRLENYNSNLVRKDKYTGVIKVYSNKATGIGDKKKLHVIVDGSVVIDQPLVVGENTINVPEFTYVGNNSNIDFDLDGLETNTEIKILSAQFTPVEEGWVAVENSVATEVKPWTLQATFDEDNTQWGALSYKDISSENECGELGDTLIRVRSSSGWDTWDTIAKLQGYMNGRSLTNFTDYDLVVTYYSSKASINESKSPIVNVCGENLTLPLSKCDDLSDVKRVNIGTFTYRSYMSKDVTFKLDQVSEGTSLSIKYIEFVESYSDKDYDVGAYKSSDTYPKQSGKVFAGWFEDDEYSEAHMEETGSAYAKFIDEDVLGSAKFQFATDGTAVRFLGSLDDSNYSNAGFIISGSYDGHKITNKKRYAKKLYRGVVADGVIARPSTYFSPDSNYFYTYTLGGLEKDKEMNWSIIPFYETLDGTTVEGEAGVWPK